MGNHNSKPKPEESPAESAASSTETSGSAETTTTRSSSSASASSTPTNKPATAINSNAWYQVTDGGVDKAGKKFSSMLQVDNKTEELKVDKPVTPPYYWQFQPVNSTNNTGLFVIRNSRDGSAKQLSACRLDAAASDDKTGVCMRDADGGDDAQLWQVDQWGDNLLKNGLRLSNAANGTGFLLDVRKDSPPFLNKTGEGVKKGEPAQTWLISSAQAVNAIEYSTIFTKPTSTSTTTTSTSTTSTATPTSSTPSSSGGLSTGASAGIGIGVGVVGLAILAAAGLFVYRLRKGHHRPQDSTSIHSSPDEEINMDKTLPPPPPPKLLQPIRPPANAGAGPGFQAALPTEPVEMGEPVQRFELDSTPVSR